MSVSRRNVTTMYAYRRTGWRWTVFQRMGGEHSFPVATFWRQRTARLMTNALLRAYDLGKSRQ